MMALGACLGETTVQLSPKHGGTNPDGTPPTGQNPGGPAGSAGGEPHTPPAIDAAPAQLRRLSPEQFTNSVSELLGGISLPLGLPDGEVSDVSMLTIERLDQIAEAVIASKAHHAQVPCAVETSGTTTCGHGFIDAFAPRAFRRPLTDDERTWLRDIFDQAKTAHGFVHAIDMTTQVILQSPQFFYLHEEGVADASLPEGVRRLSGYERASRLSYFLWNTAPDQTLLEAAANGELDTPEGVRAQTERMLADERSRAMFRRFVIDWLELDGTSLHPALEEVVRDNAVFPLDSKVLRSAMRTEVEALVDRVLDQGGTFSTLLTTRDAYVNQTLAKLYGVSDGPADDQTFKWVTLNAQQRAGLFTRGAFLLLQSNAQVKSPIRRGAFLVEHVLCRELGEPPPNANDTPIVGGNIEGQRLTVRDAVHLNTSGPSCSGCHSIINPAGFPLDHYNGIGQYEEVETGKDEDGTAWELPIDASGQFVVADIKDPFSGGVALSEVLAKSKDVRHCVAERLFTHAFARHTDPHEASSLDWVKAEFAATDNLRALVLAIVQSPAFLHVRSQP